MDDGGPVFPHLTYSDIAGVPTVTNLDRPGMSLRDWFAGQALIGQVIRQELAWVAASSGPGCLVETVMARRAYNQADAMLKERKK